MKRKPEIWGVIALELAFALCALSVLLYRYLGIAFDFAWFSYRVFNISFSIVFIFYLVYALLKSQKYALILASLFSLFHFVEGIFIKFWLKTIIHGLILIIVGIYYYRYKKILVSE